jgi:hypothetical protein
MANFKFLQEEIKSPVKKELQFPKLKIRHPVPSAKIQESWIIENGDVVELGKEVEIITIAVRGQYFRYDTQLQRTTHLSEIKPSYAINSAKCLKTNKTVEQLKNEFKEKFKIEFKFVLIVYGIVKVENAWKDVIWYVKASALQSLIEIQKELGLKNIVGYYLQLGLKVNKSGGVVYATPLLKKHKNLSELPDNVLKSLPDLDKLYKAFMKEVSFYNSPEPSFKEEATADDIPVEF